MLRNLETKGNNFLPIIVDEEILARIMDAARKKKKKVLAIVVATKPCFYKLWGLMERARAREIPFMILNTGQHYDSLVGFGLKELNFEKFIPVNLNLRGDLSQKSAEMFSKAKTLYNYLKKNWPDVDIIPYVNGDTVTAGIFPAAWMFATNEKVIQGEAGLRSMSPKFFKNLDLNIKPEDFVKKQFEEEWILVRDEPFPEQWDTFVSAAGSHYLLAPTEINKQHLIREGHSEDLIWLTGNTVVDVLKLKKKMKPEKSIFEIYPQLKEGEWLRVDIHRRGNLTEKRFRAIIESIKKLVKNGYKVAFIELNATRVALEHYGLYAELRSLTSQNPNFLFTPLWKEYGHVIEFLMSEHCWAIMTDSGSMQEEMNALGKPCFTLRFNTDRPESVKEAKTNLLIPPINADFTFKVIDYIYKNKELRDKLSKGSKIYGENVADKTLDILEKHALNQDAKTFHWAHETLGVWKEEKKDIKYL